MSSRSLIQVAVAFIVGALLFGLLVSGCSDGGLSSYESNVQDLGGNFKLTLDFSSSDITDDDLKSLDFPTALTEINLAHTAITDEGVAELKRASNLKTVVLVNTQITSQAIEHLKEMPSLMSANIISKGIPVDEIHKFTKYLNTQRPTQELRDAYEIKVDDTDVADGTSLE